MTKEDKWIFFGNRFIRKSEIISYTATLDGVEIHAGSWAYRHPYEDAEELKILLQWLHDELRKS